MKKGNSLLTLYVTKEFGKNFLVSFVFFFAIFFVNSILLLVQKILLKNISVGIMVEMVLLYMPQFLVYTFPFATLTASSMVLGDMASSNELLAIRSLGITNRRIYSPLVIASIFLSICTFLVADVLHPYTSVIYKEKLAVLMAEMPTLEIESNSVNTIGSIIVSNGHAEGSQVDDIVILSSNDPDYNKTVLSPRGQLTIEDPVNFVYSLELSQPEVFMNDVKDSESFAYANGSKAVFYLDFSSQIPSLTSTSPVNLTSRELWKSIQYREQGTMEDRKEYWERKESILMEVSSALKEKERDGGLMIFSSSNDLESLKLDDAYLGPEPTSYYGNYYKTELTKKFALSLACFVFTLVTLPLSNVRVKHGKLTGFAIAILIAVAYWYMLFAAQIVAFDVDITPYLIIMMPNLFLLGIALVLLSLYRKAR